MNINTNVFDEKPFEQFLNIIALVNSRRSSVSEIFQGFVSRIRTAFNEETTNQETCPVETMGAMNSDQLQGIVSYKILADFDKHLCLLRRGSFTVTSAGQLQIPKNTQSTYL